MNRFILLFIFVWLFVGLSIAQQGIDIKVKINNYNYDTLWLGQTFGKRAVPIFFGLKNKEGFFELKQNTPLNPGIHAIIYKRASNANFQYIQCAVANGQRIFTIETDLNQPYRNPKISGSNENVLLFRYLTAFQKMDTRLDSVIVDSRLRNNEASFLARVKVEEEMNLFQEDIIQANKGTVVAEFVRRNQLLLPPKSKSKDWKQESAERWNWQRTHFFDRIELGGSDYMSYPQFIDQTDFYLLYLPPPHVDTTKLLMDEILTKLQSKLPEAYEYYQKYLTNSLARMSQFQLDELFVHMIKNYVLAGKAPWTPEQDLQRMRNEANMMEPLFVGKTAPDVTLYNRKAIAVSLSSIRAPVIMLAFWMPDCSHCQKEMPILKKVSEKYKAKGLKVVSVCGKSRDETPQCWKFVDENALPPDWYQLTDPELRSRMSLRYNLRSFPRLFILDGDKKIVFKRAGETSELELTSHIDNILSIKK